MANGAIGVASRPTLPAESAKEVMVSLTQEARQGTLGGTAYQRAQELDKERQAHPDDPEAVLRLGAERKAITFDTRKQVDERFSPDTDGNYAHGSPGERADTAAAVAKEVAEGRFANLPENFRKNIVGTLTAGILDRRGIFQQFAPGEIDTIKASIINRLIGDDKFEQKVAEFLIQRFGPDSIDQQLASARAAFDQAAQALEDAEGEGKSYRQVVTELVEFEEEKRDAAGSVIGPGKKFQKMQALEAYGIEGEGWMRAQERTWDKNFPQGDERARGKLADIEVQAEDLLTRRGTDVFTDESVAITVRNMVKYKVNQQYRDLLGEKRELQQQYRKLSRLAKNAEDRGGALAAQEERLATSLENILLDSGNAVVEEEISKRVAIEQNRLEEEGKTAKDRDEKVVDEVAKNRWDKPPKRRGKREVLEVNKGNVIDDVNTVFTAEHGPRTLVAKFLLTGLEKRYAAGEFGIKGSTSALGARKKEKERIEKRVNEDEEFTNRMVQKIVPGLFTRYIYAGGKVYKDDIRVLRDTDWGKNTIMTAINENKEIQNEIRTVLGANALTDVWWKDTWRTMTDSGFLKWLLIALGVGTVAALGLGAAGTSLPALGAAAGGLAWRGATGR